MTAQPQPSGNDLPTVASAVADLIAEKHTPDLWPQLVHLLGDDERKAAAAWRQAAALLEQRHPATRWVRGPRPYERVWTCDGVDHEPVPGEEVMRCGIEVPDLDRHRDLNEPHGTPCTDCWSQK